jgi:hypothetical protein
MIDLAIVIIPTIVTLLAGYLGYRYGLAHLRREKYYEFLEKQLKEFYSPMLGYLEEIRAKSNVRYEIFKATDPVWKKIVSENPIPFLDSDKYFEPFKKQIFYDNKQLREELIPLYRRMCKVFSKNIGIVNQSTRKWYYELTRFVEIWERWLADSIPVEVIIEIEHKEERLFPFYKDLENNMSELLRKLASKKK